MIDCTRWQEQLADSLEMIYLSPILRVWIMNTALADIGMTITQPLFSLALVLIATRFLAQLCGVSGYNPISIAVRRITDPVVKPFSTLIPSGNRFNAGGLVALILCQVLFIAIIETV